MSLQNYVAWTHTRNTCPHYGHFYYKDINGRSGTKRSIVASGKPHETKLSDFLIKFILHSRRHVVYETVIM